MNRKIYSQKSPRTGKSWNAFLEKMIPGHTFTGSEHCFQGRVEVLSYDLEKNELNVYLTSRLDTEPVRWSEFPDTWNLEHTFFGFKNRDYYSKNYPNNWPELVLKQSQSKQ